MKSYSIYTKHRSWQIVTVLLTVLLSLLPVTTAQAGSNTVNPNSTDWALIVETAGTHSATFVEGPATPPSGFGSLRMTVDGAAGIAFATQKNQGVRLSNVQTLSYATFVTSGSGATGIAFQINYDPDLSDTSSPKPWYGRLVYEPYRNGTVTIGSWQTWDMLDGGSAVWWATANAISTVDDTCGQNSPCTLNTILTNWPNIGIRADSLSGILFKAGSGWTGGFDGNLDNFVVEVENVVDTYDFEPYLPVHNITQNTRHATIQEGIDAASSGDVLEIDSGTYIEELVIDKPLTLLGPNAAINPNTGARVAEAIILPAQSGTDPFGTCTVQAYIDADDVSIKGLTFDGNNPALTSGVLVNGVDVDACEGLAAYGGVGGLVIENNILANITYAGMDFYNYNNSGNATSGNYIRYNRIANIGNSNIGYGIGTLLYNNFYADIAHNVYDNVRVGIQTGNYYRANPGVTGSISNNTINAWRSGIFHNLWYQNASVISVVNNTINAVDSTGATSWNGMLLSSWQNTANTLIQDNTINVGDITQTASGYNIWNTPTSAALTISGGSVTGGDYGVFVNNFDGYNSNASNTFIKVDGVEISGAAVAGVYVKDNPSNTNAARVYANIQYSTITNSAIGIWLDGPDASAKANNSRIHNNIAGLKNNSGNVMDATMNWWGSNDGPVDLLGTIEVPADPKPAVADMLNAEPAGLLGNSVSEDADYYPWSIAPTVLSITRADIDPTSAVSVDFIVTFSEAVTGVDASDFSQTITGGISGASMTDVSGSGDTYVVSVNTGAGNGAIRLDLKASGTGIKDLDGNPILGGFTTGEVYTVQKDVETPTILSIVRQSPAEQLVTSGTTVIFRVTFSEDVTNVAASDFALTLLSMPGANASISSVTPVSLSVYDVVVDITSLRNASAKLDGAIRLDVPITATISDLSSNTLSGLPFSSGQVYSIVQEQTFIDVPPSYWAWTFIERLYYSGVTTGCGAGIYCPGASVTRAQMAVFLLRGIHGPSYTPPPVGASTNFTDVPTTHWAAAWIKQLKAQGITTGCGADIYCPEAPVTRDQMAVFLLRAKHGAFYAPPAVGTTTNFTDVPTTYWAAAWIKQLAAEGITTGCGAGIYCPANTVLRDQMAVFLVRTFNLP